jgi:hypothetical protein
MNSIDLSQPNALSLKAVSALLRSKDNTQPRQLRVAKEGVAFISDQTGNDNLDGLLFRFETWSIGNAYCGEDAANDMDWVKKIYSDLRDNWPEPKSTYIDW